jgi:FkbM family methyltransferase
LPYDQVMLPLIVANCGWSLETLEFLQKRIDPASQYAVIDIGANIGLFSRQAALKFRNIKRFVCIEPEPTNFRALQYNLSAQIDNRGRFWNVALSDTDGTASLLRDKDNCGNCSLNSHAMHGRPFDTIVVQSVSTDGWMRRHIDLIADELLLWKSDTQGYDELIVSFTPIEIWNRIDIAIVELWRIKKPNFDHVSFADRISAFPNKSIGLGNRNTTDNVLEFLNGDDRRHADLYLWR